MGLDNFWRMPDETDENPVEHPEFDPELNLCGGMFSGHGSGSFRGKVYSGIVEHVTGVSLYEDKIDNETVKEMAEKLAELEDGGLCLTDGAIQLAGDYGLESHEVHDLIRMFKGYADAGATLISWY